MARHLYEVVMAAGCHRDSTPPVVSRHRSLAAAVRRARRSDRLAVEPADSAVTIYRAQSQQPTKYGFGCYGGADTRPFAVCLAEAVAAERERVGQ